MFFLVFNLSVFFVGQNFLLTAQADSGDPIISITSPAGGESYNAGETIAIKWNQTNVDSVWIGYKICDPSCLDWISPNHAVNINDTSGQYDWKIPDNFNSGKYKIEIIAYHTGVGSASTKSQEFSITGNTNPTPIPDPTPTPTPTPIMTDAYKAVVKVNTFILDEDYNLSLKSSGSGVILKSDGTLLTNYHVIESEDSFAGGNEPASYQICISQSTVSEPDCSYVAKLLAVNKNLDLAILKIQIIPGVGSMTTFPFLEVRSTDVAVNDTLTTVGYPAIGSETVTVSSGIVSGKVSKYGSSWIKTDAVVSYGNSGGAALDSQNKLVGITTAVDSDVLGSLGYIISSLSFSSWLSSNLNMPAQDSTILGRLVEFTKKQSSINAINAFVNAKPRYSIVKDSSYRFTMESEDIIEITNNEDADGGDITIYSHKFPYNPTIDNIIPFYKFINSELALSAVLNINSEQTVTVSGKTGKKIVSSFQGVKIYDYWFPHGEYLINIKYIYGQDDKDKAIVDSIIQTINFLPQASITEEKSFSHGSPAFSLSAGNDWSFKSLYYSQKPLEMFSKSRREAYGDIVLQKIDDDEKGNGNEFWLQQKKQKIADLSSSASMVDLKFEVGATSAHHRLNSKLTDVVMMETVDKKLSSGEIISRGLKYFIKSSGILITVEMEVFSSDQGVFNSAKQTFNSMLQSMTLTGTSGSTGQVASGEEKAITNQPLYNKLKGNILLKVQDSGKAYYVHPTNKKTYFLGRPSDAFTVMRQQGVGITNADLQKIPIGLGPVSGLDQDNDGLSDLLEDALGTNKTNSDTDGDGNSDKTEVVNNYSPITSGKLPINSAFAKTQSGRILIQVQSKGEAWYINPKDNKRYFLGRAEDAFSVMRGIGIGITNRDFDSLN